MAKTDFRTVDDYLASRSPEEREALLAIQAAILDAVPEAEAVISYQIPAYKADGWLFYISAYANHYSLSCPPPFFEEHAKELSAWKVSKSAVQFPKDQPIPLALISDMAKARAKGNRERAGKSA